MLVSAAQAGDVMAWQKIDARYRARLEALVHGRIPIDIRQRYDTEDLVQSTLLTAYSDLDSFEDEGNQSFRRWISTMIMNRMITRIRHERAQKRDSRLARETIDEEGISGESDLEESTPEGLASRADELARLFEIASTLGEENLALIRRHFLEGKSFALMGQELGVAASTVRRRILAIIETLRVRLRESEEQLGHE